jgi:hypothetical protein
MKPLFLTLVIATLALPALAQDALPPPPPPPQVEAPPQPPRAPQPPRPPAPPQAEREMPPTPPAPPPPPRDVRPIPTRNVKIDVTITDQDDATPLKKVVSLVIADGRSGQVRSSTFTSAGGNQKHLPLSVDATPVITPDQKVLLELRLQYSGIHDVRDGTVAADAPVRPRRFAGDILETLNILLTPGTPITVARSADAATDRTVTVEVKADILK